MRYYLTIIALLLSSLLLRSQTLDVSERWLMNERLMDLVDSYERYSAFEGRSDAYSFLGLFRSPDVEVWCDYVAGEHYGKYIPARQYVEYSKILEDRNVMISRLKKSDYEYTGGRWRTRIEFDKQVEYEDSLGFTFSTRSPLVGGDFHIIIECAWQPDNEEFLIERITGVENPRMSFPKEHFQIVQRKNEIDSRVLYNGEPLDFNEYGFVVLPEGGTYDFDDDDYDLMAFSEPGTPRYDIYSFSVKQKRLRARAHSGFTYNPLKVETVYGDALAPSSFAVDFGVDFGISISLGKSFKYVPYVGAGYAHTWFDMSTAMLSDNGNVQYTYLDRYYNLVADERFAFDDVVVALSPLSFEINMSKKAAFIIDAGVKAYLNLSAKDGYEINFTSPAEVNLLNGYLSPNVKPFGPAEGEPNFWVLSAFGKLGADIGLSKGLFLSVRAGAEYGLGSDTGSLRNVLYTNKVTSKYYDSSNGVYPVVYRNNAQGRIEDIKVHSFKNSIKSISRGLAIVGEVGVKFKF